MAFRISETLLATRAQLIYPSSALLAIDGHPHRWEVAEVILGLVAHHLRNTAHEFPHNIDLIDRKFSKRCVEMLELHTLFSRPADHGQGTCTGR